MIPDRTKNRPRWRLGAAFLAAGVFLGACASSNEANGGAVNPTIAGEDSVAAIVAPTGDPVPVLDPARTLDGAQLDWNSLEGKDVVLWFWAPW